MFSDEFIEVTAVAPLDGYRLELTFSDGTTGVADVARLIWGPAFETIRSDPAEFARVRVDAGAGTVVWPNGADLDPDMLHRLVGPTNPA